MYTHLLSLTQPIYYTHTPLSIKQVCRVITNTDVRPIVPTVIAAYADPTKTEAGLDALSGCTFIQVRTLCLLCSLVG